MNKTACLALLFSASCATFAAGPLRETFRSPQGAARENTGPLFWMHGTETPERLREYVGRVDESGQGILTIESRPHVDWMRAGWWRDVTRAVKEGANTLETKPFRLKTPRIVIVSAAPAVLHVDAERGDDAGDGSAARPFKTPAKAKDAVRALKKAGAPGGVVVEMEGVFSGLKGPIVDLGKDDAFADAAASADPRKVQDLPQFRAAFPSFPRIPVEKIGLGR